MAAKMVVGKNWWTHVL